MTMMQQQPMHNPFYASTQQQQAYMLQQQQAFVMQQHQYQQQYQQMMMAGPSVQASSNPFDGSYMPAAGGGGYLNGPARQLHAGNAYSGTGMM
jgi:hypothetical protein